MLVMVHEPAHPTAAKPGDRPGRTPVAADHNPQSATIGILARDADTSRLRAVSGSGNTTTAVRAVAQECGCAR